MTKARIKMYEKIMYESMKNLPKEDKKRLEYHRVNKTKILCGSKNSKYFVRDGGG
ncbi:MAG TPA: hypothetical protein VNA25_05030 [Phycisphaerae bacterium]|nr:hypothetical protein [Phycisphaerae bacterium]